LDAATDADEDRDTGQDEHAGGDEPELEWPAPGLRGPLAQLATGQVDQRGEEEVVDQ
jgi:hypothetical protein